MTLMSRMNADGKSRISRQDAESAKTAKESDILSDLCELGVFAGDPALRLSLPIGLTYA
jgi:hypothetical protein